MCAHLAKESHDQRVDLPADDVCTIKRMVTFMYTKDYDEDYSAREREDNEFSELCPLLDATNTSIHGTVAQIHLKVYQAADKFGIEHLKPLVIDKLAKWVESVLHSHSFLLYVTEIIKMAPAHDKALVYILANTITKHFRHFQAHKEDDLKDFIMANRPIGSLILINLIEEGRITGQKQEQVAKLWRLLTINRRTQAKCPSCHCNLRVIL